MTLDLVAAPPLCVWVVFVNMMRFHSHGYVIRLKGDLGGPNLIT